MTNNKGTCNHDQELQQLEKLKKELANNNTSNCFTKIKRMLFNSPTTEQKIDNLFANEFIALP
jgi:hypothetical protein